MQQLIRGVAKKDQTKPSQPYRLGVRTETPTGQPKARILQQDDESAVIEVTCECGKRVFLTCRFDG
jgi:hypothetical protein